MSNRDALHELDHALEHIQRARESADREITSTELENLEVMAEDCLAGVKSDVNSDDSGKLLHRHDL